MNLNDPFGRSALPPGFSRADRVRMLAELAESLLAGREPSRAAALFVGGAIQAYLQAGGRIGSFERDFLKIAAPARSTMTPARLLASDARATGFDDQGMIDTLTPDIDEK